MLLELINESIEDTDIYLNFIVTVSDISNSEAEYFHGNFTIVTIFCIIFIAIPSDIAATADKNDNSTRSSLSC